MQHEQSNSKVAHLETIDFAKLLAHEEAEISKLVSACATAGFFYVDLRGQSARTLIEDEESMYQAMAEYFDQPLDVKMKDDRGTHKHGYATTTRVPCLLIVCRSYKPPGVFAGVKENSKDNYETLKVCAYRRHAMTP